MSEPFAPKQVEFLLKSTAKWNLAHGSVRSGKTVCTLFRFMQAAYECPDSQIYMVGHTSDTIYRNAVRLIFESEQLAYFKPFCSWLSGKRQLKFFDKTIQTLGAKDDGAIGNFQGLTFSLCYCDEMTLYPTSIIDMIDTRLSNAHSMGFASMNPAHPDHKIKQWIDKAENGDANYFQLHFTLDDNPYVDEQYKQRIRDSLSGLFYKRNYLGLWCLAEGAIFDFFDRNIHVLDTPPCAAEYWIAGIDYGVVNPFCCLLVGVSTGRYTGTGKRMWVEKEYYYDPKVTGRQKTNSEFAHDVAEFLEPYAPKNIYIDPSAEAMQLELRRMGLHVVHANNSVLDGIGMMTSEMKKGNLYVLEECKNTIREIESYVWDSKKAARGIDEPLKANDHACVVGDTLVMLSDGSQHRIKDLEDQKIRVFTYYENEGLFGSTNAHISKTGVQKQIFLLELHKSLPLRCTYDHKVFTSRGYVQVKDLTLKDEVKCIDGYFHEISAISTCKDTIEDVYCMYVPETNNFISNGIVSHNCDALRYLVATHKFQTHKEEVSADAGLSFANRFEPTRNYY